jgi:FkbM family methyltransferase
MKESQDYIQFQRVREWYKAIGNENLRLNYELDENSIVLDIGGYKGEFARDIFCKYQSHIFLFEPIPDFFNIASNRFLKNSKVQTYNFGLSNKTCKALINVNDNASSTIKAGEKNLEISLMSTVDFIKEKNLTSIDLIKINIEGGEYDLLESILKYGDIKLFRNIQVQFHDFVVENAKERMKKIQIELAKTHHLTYQYEFVWENWELNPQKN